MKWQARVEDPSGETRVFALQSSGAFTLGRSDESTIALRDSTVAFEAAQFWATPLLGKTGVSVSPFWMRINDGMPPAFVGDLGVREAQVPAGVVIRFGETRVTFEPLTSDMGLPSFPHGIRPWLTQSQDGRELLWMAKKAAATPLSLYIAGETGTGKEVLAHLLHAWSDRASGPFVPLHCGALSLSLIESELFGHVKGAFTGAHTQRPGALMQAHNGTLFLDEVGDLPLDIQVKLLRFLENGEIRPVGADRCSHADVRLLCATHHPLLKLVEQGKFRRDLYYRLASVTLQIPNLRSRPQDIEMLALKFASGLGRTLSPQALLRLKAHRWPGNRTRKWTSRSLFSGTFRRSIPIFDYPRKYSRKPRHGNRRSHAFANRNGTDHDHQSFETRPRQPPTSCKDFRRRQKHTFRNAQAAQNHRPPKYDRTFGNSACGSAG
jgi:hypothetical protein